MGVPQWLDGFCEQENPMKMDDDLGVPLFLETTRS